jgi:hypothetical protein
MEEDVEPEDGVDGRGGFRVGWVGVWLRCGEISSFLKAFPSEFFRNATLNFQKFKVQSSKSVSPKKMKRTKRFVSARNVDSERSGEGLPEFQGKTERI